MRDCWCPTEAHPRAPKIPHPPNPLSPERPMPHAWGGTSPVPSAPFSPSLWLEQRLLSEELLSFFSLIAWSGATTGQAGSVVPGSNKGREKARSRTQHGGTHTARRGDVSGQGGAPRTHLDAPKSPQNAASIAAHPTHHHHHPPPPPPWQGRGTPAFALAIAPLR